MRSRKFTLIAAAALVGAALMSPARSQSEPLTTGRFAVLLANFGNNGAAVGEAQALQQLRRVGVPLRPSGDLLTEGELARIMSVFGLQATTSNPKAPVGETLANSAAGMISNTLPYTSLQERRREAPPLEGDVSICLSERNHGQCVNCCKDFGQRANVCAKFCMNLEPPSPSGP